MTDFKLPWSILPDWQIVGMNHYRQDGELRLFVAMTREIDGRRFCIQDEGPDDKYLWSRLWHQAARAEALPPITPPMPDPPADDSRYDREADPVVLWTCQNCYHEFESGQYTTKQCPGCGQADWEMLDFSENHAGHSTPSASASSGEDTLFGTIVDDGFGDFYAGLLEVDNPHRGKHSQREARNDWSKGWQLACKQNGGPLSIHKDHTGHSAASVGAPRGGEHSAPVESTPGSSSDGDATSPNAGAGPNTVQPDDQDSVGGEPAPAPLSIEADGVIYTEPEELFEALDRDDGEDHEPSGMGEAQPAPAPSSNPDAWRHHETEQHSTSTVETSTARTMGTPPPGDLRHDPADSKGLARTNGHVKLPSKDDARTLGKQYQTDHLIIVYIRGGDFGYASYGATASLCEESKRLGDVCYEAIERDAYARAETGGVQV